MARPKRRRPKVKFELHHTLRKVMEERGMTEQDLAWEAGLSLYAVRLVLSGNQRATLAALVAVAFVLGYRLDLHIYKPSLLERIAEAACD